MFFARARCIYRWWQLLREKGVTVFRELRGELGDFHDRTGAVSEPDHIVYLVSD